MSTTTGSDTVASGRRSATSHMPGLDGLRGLLVPIILLYHLGIAGFGGFFALDGFFVLSGFLIALLLLDHPPGSGSALGQWWLRRWRRLIPAVVVVVTVVVVVFRSTAGIGVDAVSSLTWWRNWAMAFGTTTYWSTAPSPLKHLWSLSVEEQFYLVFPLLVVVCIRIAGRRRRSPASVVAVLAGSLAVAGYLWQAWSATTGGDLNRVYVGTDTRAGAILLGCCGGAVMSASRGRREPTPRRWTAAAAAASAVIVWAGLTFGIEDLGTYHGGFAAVGVSWLVITVAASRPGPVATALSVPALRWIGVRSYGIYLWSWPVQVYVQARWPALPLPTIAVLTVVVAFALGAASYTWVEQPLRRRSGWADGAGLRRVSWAGGLAVAFAATAVVGFTQAPTTSLAMTEDSSRADAARSVERLLAERGGRSTSADSSTAAPAAPTAPGAAGPSARTGPDPSGGPTPAPVSTAASMPMPTLVPASVADRPLVVLVGGDSQAATIALDVKRSELPPYIGRVANAGVLGCGVLVRTPGWSVELPVRGFIDGGYCRGPGSADDLEAKGLSAHPDWLVITSGGFEQSKPYRAPDGRVLPPDDPGIRAAIQVALAARIERASRAGTRVALLEFACPGRTAGEPNWDEFTRASIEWHNSNLREVAAAHPGTITIPPTEEVCVQGDAAGTPTAAKAEAWGVADRVHVTDVGQKWVWNVQIGPALLAASR